MACLHTAAACGDTDAVRTLLHAGADMSALDARGWSAADIATYHGHMLTITPLLSSAASTSSATAPVAADREAAPTAISYDPLPVTDTVHLDEPLPLHCPNEDDDNFDFSASNINAPALRTLTVRVRVHGLLPHETVLVRIADGSCDEMSADKQRVAFSITSATTDTTCTARLNCAILVRSDNRVADVELAACAERVSGSHMVVDFGAYTRVGSGAFVRSSCLGASHARLHVRLGHATRDVRRAPIEWCAPGELASLGIEYAAIRIVSGCDGDGGGERSAFMSQTTVDALQHCEFGARVERVLSLCTLRFECISPDGARVVAYAHVDARALCDAKEGVLTAPLMSATHGVPRVLGRVCFEFLLVMPLALDQGAMNHRLYSGARVFANSTRIWGHRGCGAEGASTDERTQVRRLQVAENTTASFDAARTVAPDLEWVEFDVMLTKDLQPVIFHDYDVPVVAAWSRRHALVECASRMPASPAMRQRVCGEHGLDACTAALPLNALTLAQFRSLIRVRARARAIDDVSVGWSTHGADAVVPARDARTYIQDALPTLEQVLCHGVAPETGRMLAYNVEVKYPSHAEKERHNLHVLERNAYVDTILACIARHAGTRRIVFSSFDPDVCAMLALKQARYPVFFLTEAGGWEQFCDPRLNSLYEAARFVRRCGLYGCVTYCAPLLAAPVCAHELRRQGAIDVIATWGTDNNDAAQVRRQMSRAIGVDAAISDHLQLLSGCVRNPM